VEQSILKFSIIIPCYNSGLYLHDCLKSLSVQPQDLFEVIFIDDGSSDDSFQIFLNYKSLLRNVIFIRKRNGGLSSARNAGLRKARGKYLLFLDADDYLLPSALSSVDKFLQERGEFQLCRTGYQYVDHYGLNIMHMVFPETIKNPLAYICNSNIGPCHSIYINREFALGLGEFDETLSSAEDWDFWIRALKAGGKLIDFQKITCSYRYVLNSMSRNPLQMFSAICNVLGRAPLYDSRITIDSPFNQNLEVDNRSAFSKAALECLGVSLMQGDIEKSIDFYERCKAQSFFVNNRINFRLMNSYLSFRYWSTKSELELVLHQIVPLYRSFFIQIGLSSKDVRLATLDVFGPSLKKYNHLRYGQLLGGIFNKLNLYYA
jgi:glycosyltransferase involved in cell wall biosynthesis